MQKQSKSQQQSAHNTTRLSAKPLAPHHIAHPILNLQRTIGNQAVRRLPHANAEALEADSDTSVTTRFGHDFSRIPIHAKAPAKIQAKLTVNTPGDVYEQEADWIAEQVTATPTRSAMSGPPPRIQLFSEQSNGQMDAIPVSVDQALASQGRPLEPALRQDMGQRLGYDFSHVRVHSGATAEQSARDVNAKAYTVGHDIVFGAGRFAPGTNEGRRLIAHELTHVVQQSGADKTYAGQDNEKHGPPSLHLHQAPQASIQRQADFGMATSQNVSGYATKVETYKNDRANQNKSFEDLTRYAVGVLNDELLAMGIPIMTLQIRPIPTVAQFAQFFWVMSVNSTEFTGRSGPMTVGQLTKQKMSDLVASLYHEARHAEQSFKVARFLASKGKSERDISLDTPILIDVAKQARAKPLAVIDPAIADFAADLGEQQGKRAGDDPKDIAKRTQDFRKRVTENNQEAKQAEDWYLEKPLKDLIYDNDRKIRDPLTIIQGEAQKRRSGDWDTLKLQPAVAALRDNVLSQFDTEIRRVSAQQNRSRMVTHLTSLRQATTEMIDIIQEQTNSRTLVFRFDLIELNAQLIVLTLENAYVEILTEADAYTQGEKACAALGC